MTQQMQGPKLYLMLIFFILFCEAIGMLGGFITEYSVENWYPTLVKPAWTPPDQIFPIVWSILYAMMGVALWFVWKSPNPNKTEAYTAFGIQLFLNFIWSWLFFYYQNPFLGLIDIILLWFAIFATIYTFNKHSRIAAWLLIPYFLWVSYAISLNLFIWMYN